MAEVLAEVVGGSTSFWLKRQANFERALALAAERSQNQLDELLANIPPPMKQKPGRLSAEQKAAEVRGRMVFWGVGSLAAWNSRYGQLPNQTKFRTSGSFASHAPSVSLWLRQGELEAALTSTKRWNPQVLVDALPDVLKLSKIGRIDRFLPMLKEIGAQAGVAIVAARAPEGCKASGASLMVEPEKAMVLLSFRHRSDDHFWFTLLHEFGHLVRHNAQRFVDTDETDLHDKQEQEANEFAHMSIIPVARWEEFSGLSPDWGSVLRFSVSLGVSAGLVAGQLEHKRNIPPSRLSRLKRRWTWEEIDAAIGG